MCGVVLRGSWAAPHVSGSLRYVWAAVNLGHLRMFTLVNKCRGSFVKVSGDSPSSFPKTPRIIQVLDPLQEVTTCWRSRPAGGHDLLEVCYEKEKKINTFLWVSILYLVTTGAWRHFFFLQNSLYFPSCSLSDSAQLCLKTTA